MRQTKIVCTIGPASDNVETLKAMILEGMNVARLNFSHGSYEEHGNRLKMLNLAVKELERDVAILLDTKGPEIRLGELNSAKIKLIEGNEVTITTEDTLGNEEQLPISYQDLDKDVKPGDKILIDDGLIALEVLKVYDKKISCKILNSGEISSRKGVNVPGVNVNLPAVTPKDIDDIDFAIKNDFDFIAASFIRSASDVLEVREIIENAHSDIQIIAKIECQAAVDNIDEIIQVADGIMVARGDLGVEIPPEEVPLVQKLIIKKCNKAGKLVITATQMLDSMIRNPRPTRAEANDVANAIFDGTDAVMLSGESAAGKYPVEAVKFMASIATKTEQAVESKDDLYYDDLNLKTVTDSIAHATISLAKNLRASAIITPTLTGSTAKMVAKYRPKIPIIATTFNNSTKRKLSLVWGVESISIDAMQNTDEMINLAINESLKAGRIKLGDLVIVTAGVPASVPGTTNLIKVQIVGEAVTKGTGIGKKIGYGKVQICLSAKEAIAKINEGDVLVTSSTDRDYVPAMEKAAAIITEVGGLTSHAAIVGINFGKPVIVGAKDALRFLEEGLYVTVDSNSGSIYKGMINV